MAKKEIVLSEAARRFYEDFEYCLNGVQTHLSEWLIDEYTKNASVLELLINDLKNKTRLRKQLNSGNGNIMEIIIGNSEHLRKTVGHTLPKYPHRLREKMREYNRPVEYKGDGHIQELREIIKELKEIIWELKNICFFCIIP
jgi:hypothetical protein